MKKCTLIAAAATLAAVSGAHASVMLFSVRAVNSHGVAEFDIAMPTDVRSSTVEWSLDAPITLTSNTGGAIGTLAEASVNVSFAPGGDRSLANPQIVSLGFVVSSGALSTDFTITSASLSFDPMGASMTGTASAAATLTDINGLGGIFMGNFDDNEAFRAYYNDVDGNPATGSTFDTLVSGMSTGAFNSNSKHETTGEPSPIGTDVSSISTQWKFRVGPGDMASGTSVFAVVPTPGSMALAGVGLGLGAIRRRRA